MEQERHVRCVFVGDMLLPNHILYGNVEDMLLMDMLHYDGNVLHLLHNTC
jgi:hypothetical protein